MSTILKSLPRLHIPTNNKVSKANELLLAHEDYLKIEGTTFLMVHWRTDDKYSTTPHLTILQKSK